MSTPAAAAGRAGRQTLVPLGLVFLIVGLANALVVPFVSLFLATEVHAGAVRTTVYLVAAPVSAVAAAWAIGRVSDRWPVRRPLLVGASVAGPLFGLAQSNGYRLAYVMSFGLCVLGLLLLLATRRDPHARSRR